MAEDERESGSVFFLLPVLPFSFWRSSLLRCTMRLYRYLRYAEMDDLAQEQSVEQTEHMTREQVPVYASTDRLLSSSEILMGLLSVISSSGLWNWARYGCFSADCGQQREKKGECTGPRDSGD